MAIHSRFEAGAPKWRFYRDINEADAFDKIVSVEMFEQLGEEQLPTYFKQAWRLLRPGVSSSTMELLVPPPQKHWTNQTSSVAMSFLMVR
jgi:cyclopropane fatty-acyl-phospholipid synthase-like methyltransferase